MAAHPERPTVQEWDFYLKLLSMEGAARSHHESGEMETTLTVSQCVCVYMNIQYMYVHTRVYEILFTLFPSPLIRDKIMSVVSKHYDYE